MKVYTLLCDTKSVYDTFDNIIQPSSLIDNSIPTQNNNFVLSITMTDCIFNYLGQYCKNFFPVKPTKTWLIISDVDIQQKNEYTIIS